MHLPLRNSTKSPFAQPRHCDSLPYNLKSGLLSKKCFDITGCQALPYKHIQSHATSKMSAAHICCLLLDEHSKWRFLDCLRCMGESQGAINQGSELLCMGSSVLGSSFKKIKIKTGCNVLFLFLFCALFYALSSCWVKGGARPNT